MSKDQNILVTYVCTVRAQEYMCKVVYTKRVIPVVKMKDTTLLQSLQRALRVALVFV